MNEYQELEAKKKQLEAEIQAWQMEREQFRQTVQEWRDSKEGWQLILRGGNDGIWDWDVKKNELFLSPRWKEMLGYSDRELPNHFDTWKRLLHPNDLDKSVDILQAYLNKIIPEYCTEFRLRGKDGNYKWILSRGQALWDEQGVAIRMAGSHTDISERKEEQTLLRSLIDCIPDMVFYKDCQGVYKICNNAFEGYIGQESTKIVGFTDFDLYPIALAQFFREQDRNIMNEKTSRRTEDWISDSKGYQRLFETLKTPLIGMDGKYMGVIGVGRDITERQEREKALQREAEKDNLLRRIAGKLMVKELNAAINETLAAVGEFTGSERSYIIQYSPCQRQWSMMYEWCNPLHPQIKSIQERSQNLSVDTFPWFSGQLLSGKSIKINSLEDIPDNASIEKKALETSLTPCVLIVPMLDGTNKTVGYLGLDAVASKHWTLEDISLLQLVGELIAIAEARNSAEKALKQAKEAADTANRAKSEFLANMSHELRTPLNAILGFTQVMGHSSLNGQQQDYLAIINRSGEHLLELINDILEMSKIEAGKAILNQNNFDLYRLLENLEAMLGLKAQAKNLELIFERSSDIPQYIQTDEGKLRQVLINLLGNAIKFTNRGHVILRVIYSPHPLSPSPPLPSLSLRFEVEDTGPGIAAEEVDKLFKAFTQTDVGRKSQQGTGLGLPISKKFIELMGGSIGVSSILGSGSLFAFDILVQLADAQKVEKEQPTQKVIGIEPNQPTYRILVVDDRAESRLLMVELLSKMGFSVQQAANGREAVETWETWNPHLIWMDMRMPVMDGYEATQRIKSTPKGQKTVIIALTASAFEEDRNLVLSAGCDDFVRKPFKEAILWKKIAQYLRVRFIYEDSTPSNHASLTIATTENQQLDTQLAQMPQAWLNQLEQAAYKCSDDEIVKMSDQIPLEFADLKTVLQELTHDFRFEAILDLLKTKV